MNKSESIANLAAALAAAQGEVENASKNAANPHFKNKYADLAEILNTVRPVLATHGLAISQFPGFDNGIVTLETIITHKSGEWMSSVAGSPVGKMDAQGVGSALTYLRRYSLAAVVGIAQEDDDGNAAAKPRNQPQSAANDIDQAEYQAILKKLQEASVIGLSALEETFKAIPASHTKSAVWKDNQAELKKVAA